MTALISNPYCHTVYSCIFNDGLNKFPSIATAHTLPCTQKQITKKIFPKFSEAFEDNPFERSYIVYLNTSEEDQFF